MKEISFPNGRTLKTENNRIIIVDEFGTEFDFGQLFPPNGPEHLSALCDSLADSATTEKEWQESFAFDLMVE